MATSKHAKRISVHVQKKQNESNDKLIARFQKLAKSSRLVNDLKAGRYYEKPRRKRRVRSAAMMREHYREKREKEKFL